MRFAATKAGPSFSASTGVVTKMANGLSGASKDSNAGKDGLDIKAVEAPDRLAMDDIFLEDTTGVNEEAVLCLQKGMPGLLYRHHGLRQPPRRDQVRAHPLLHPANNGGAALHPTDPSTPTLFRPLTIRDVTLKNRIVVSPMCMYSAECDPSSPLVGALTDYHIAHLGHFAVKGAGLIFVEAQAVQFNGRISPNDAGLWDHSPESEQFKSLQRIVRFCHSQGAKVAVQLHHAGRKASVTAPWVATEAGKRSLRAEASVGGWPSDVVGPSGGPENIWDGTGEGYWTPRALTVEEIQDVVQAFAKSAEAAVRAGVDVLEIHGAHGYLINQFLSPITNTRTDQYGGSFENRTRLVREIATAVRAAIPSGTPLFLRISASEWMEGHDVAAESGTWNLESSLQLLPLLPELGIDLLDVSSGGNHKDQNIVKVVANTNYQIDLAAQLRKAIRKAGAPTLVGAVGFITEAEQAQGLVQGSDEAHAINDTVSGPEATADLVLLARQFLREPEWVLNAAKALGAKVDLPVQFRRAINL
ncbi:FMN-linked oxidoreductase [Aspergillus heteromorphus CBS 117.55]|uniref:FMN-linked oxidoreductase n=1 Tax=Aspergillus heteromorphus CBS 117.55 TaxID=1448321 RepID=A0A317X478_9EURO|nr:FMN-linked oxidoreductase [Aspergillus heteromorphus CBS 117.55]PWY92317.1 FMN-linked oxidoreductase [Aspergillus heteromorphus CBS 117.55]